VQTHSQRLRRARTARVAGMLLGAALAAGCGTANHSSPSATSTGDPGSSVVASPATHGPITGAYTEADINRIVLGEADAPEGAPYLGTDVGAQVLINAVWYLSTSEQKRFLELPGFLDAAASSFRQGPNDPLFVSEAVLFEDEASAEQAMAAIAEEWQVSFGFDDPTAITVDLGDGGLLYSGPATVQDGEPGFYYLWRASNLFLNMVAVGSVEGAELQAMETTVRAMALEMDRRAGDR